jgi:5,10-methylene-tetrahydrofolate dehydrogenase/methenyl tetrahydrofolate cyclohydrolase
VHFFVFLTSWPLYLPFFCSLLKGCMELLSRSGVTVKGKNAVVVGRSNIVGLPVSLLLLKADATVSIVHSRTPNPEVIVRQADIVIAAAGQAMMVRCSAGSNSLDSTGVSCSSLP